MPHKIKSKFHRKKGAPEVQHTAPEAIEVAILLGAPIPVGLYNLGEGCDLNVYIDGSRMWYRNGNRHRVDGPALEWADGTRSWYRNGLLHREDGPAVEWASGAREWFRDGKRHRDDGPAIEWANAVHAWYQDGKEVDP